MIEAFFDMLLDTEDVLEHDVHELFRLKVKLRLWILAKHELKKQA